MSQINISSWERIPCVQYGHPPDSDRPTWEPRLRTIFDPIPDGATTASPIYILDKDQYKQNCEIDSPYAVKGATSIATLLQDQCEQSDSVLYPLYVESDAFLQDGTEIFEWIGDFLGQTLGITHPEDTCKWFFSGSRSIHAHVPRFLKGLDTLERIREKAKKFCGETGAKIDTGIYTRKRMFRLPNVVHHKTDLRKTRVPYGSEREEITRTCVSNDNSVPETFEEVLRETFLSPVGNDYDPYNIFNEIDADETLVTCGADSDSGLPKENRPDWHSRHPFSPYALASQGSRSVGIFRVEGSAYCTLSEPQTAVASQRTLLPVFTYGAVGCTGEFSRSDYYSPLQLSKRDYGKTEAFGEGTNFVIIGGQSRNSKVFEVPSEIAFEASTILTDESREASLSYLSENGYDVGSGGAVSASRNNEINGSPTESATQAKKFQRRAEREDFGILHHDEKISVACRLLYRGKEFTHNWICQNMDEYDYEITEGFLTGLIEQYPEDYRTCGATK